DVQRALGDEAGGLLVVAADRGRDGLPGRHVEPLVGQELRIFDPDGVDGPAWTKSPAEAYHYARDQAARREQDLPPADGPALGAAEQVRPQPGHDDHAPPPHTPLRRDRRGLAGHRLHPRFLTHGRFTSLSLAAYPASRWPRI